MATIAFSAQTKEHDSHGTKNIIEYEITILGNAAWDKSDFTAPSDGCYFFALSFVRDAYPKKPIQGTSDDIYVSLFKNDTSMGFAWTGEGDGERSTASLSLTLELQAGDRICTQVSSANGKPRHITEAYFTGFKLD